MKILQVAPYFHPHVGGVESHVFALSRGLVELGHEVKVLTANHTNKLPTEEKFEGLEIIRVPTLANLFNTPINPSIFFKVRKLDFEVAHLHFPPPLASFFAALSLVKLKKPYVLTYHCDVELPVPLGNLIVEVYRNTMGRYTVEHASKIIVHTKTYQATSRSIWNLEPVIIPSAVDTQRFSPERFSPELKKRYGTFRIVLFVGRLVYQKGVSFLIDAFQYLPNNVLLLIVGDGPEMENLKKLAKIRNLEHRVIFLGRISHFELPSYFATCDVFVLPSVSRLEAFGLVIVEAMASGKPVVVADIPGVNEVIEDGREGLLCKPMNPEDLAEKIKRLLENPDLARRLGENGRKTALEKYEWRKIAKDVERVYMEVLRAQ
ncbi:MAG: glycosyltransferase [Thermoplasmata archaeon]|nr:glycosyltransferase [Thermoplasmata archaeon]